MVEANGSCRALHASVGKDISLSKSGKNPQMGAIHHVCLFLFSELLFTAGGVATPLNASMRLLPRLTNGGK